jgi:hypothetical protein
MADQVDKSLGLPHETAVALVDDLEKDGRIRFNGPLGITTSPSPAPESGGFTPHPLSGEVGQLWQKETAATVVRRFRIHRLRNDIVVTGT